MVVGLRQSSSPFPTRLFRSALWAVCRLLLSLFSLSSLSNSPAHSADRTSAKSRSLQKVNTISSIIRTTHARFSPIVPASQEHPSVETYWIIPFDVSLYHCVPKTFVAFPNRVQLIASP
ncbi:hypothetical protein F5Y19DRAFT_338223 [Xylariaceae sp. FL1651]|nr:hypothetical protein F5Y19DRAFT_338223 [Xylariaceae sp. FL1651]